MVVVGIASCVCGSRYYRKRRQHRWATKEMLDKLSNTQNAWKYDKLVERINEVYFAVQKAWSKQNIESVRDLLEPQFYEHFLNKQEAMKERHEKNFVKKIKLKKYEVRKVFDSLDDSEDKVWFYIKGCRVDYIYNFEFKAVTQGSTSKKDFC